jgi:hypothetical protein
MTASSGGISGVGIAALAGGGLLVYAGFRGVSPLEALRDVTSGKPAPVTSNPLDISETSASQASFAGTSNSALVNALMKHTHEQYSQARRWQEGYSDCSSFVGKGLKDIGIKPPGGSTTAAYLTWSGMVTIPRSQARAGDIAVSSSHMAVFLDSERGIGQQNPRRNVQIGDMDSNIMLDSPAYRVRRLRTQTRSVQV